MKKDSLFLIIGIVFLLISVGLWYVSGALLLPLVATIVAVTCFVVGIRHAIIARRNPLGLGIVFFVIGLVFLSIHFILKDDGEYYKEGINEKVPVIAVVSLLLGGVLIAIGVNQSIRRKQAKE